MKLHLLLPVLFASLSVAALFVAGDIHAQREYRRGYCEALGGAIDKGACVRVVPR